MNMKLTDQQKQFLEGVETYNSTFNAVRIGYSTSMLHHSFWGIDVIQKSGEMKQDWDIPEHLMPFYGDWHDLFCLDLRTGKLVMLDDSRNVVHEWPDIEHFAAALTRIDDHKSGGKGVVEAKKVELNF